MARKAASQPRTASLLVELLTEELPPKSLLRLSEVFRNLLFNDLSKSGLVGGREPRAFATPRRLAVLIPNVLGKAPDVHTETLGPPVSAGVQAVEGFARKHGVPVDSLKRQQTPKGECFVASYTTSGALLDKVLAAKVEAALKLLPVPKIMRWGAGEAQFVRPVHGLVMLHGSKVVPGEVLGLKSGNRTQGHRFMGRSEIVLADADGYERKLLEGSVIASFETRKAEIEKQLLAKAKAQNARLGEYQALLDEVTALVEHPSVYVAGFDEAFLAVPPECLILTMRQNQKYFPLFDAKGKLTPSFLVVSNMQAADPRRIIGGNERVVRPRLEDARFFFDLDRKTRLEERVPMLGKVVYHGKLGTQLERTQRIKLLAGKIARVLEADALLAERAAELAKADLLTGMVGEFPELQGVMGRYYALHDREPAAVADAIEDHYRPRFAGDGLPQGAIACSVALADKFDALAGLFSIGQQPTGDKDPYGLRRAALGVVRILVEHKLRLSLKELIHAAFEPFANKAHVALRDFLFDRFAGYLKDRGYSTLQVEAVLCKMPVNLGVVLEQLEAVKAFQALPEAESLAAANKRIANILKQAGAAPADYKADLLVLPEERTLAATFGVLGPQVDAAYQAGDYKRALTTLAGLRKDVDAFFDKVMVMDKDESVRANRIGLLHRLHATMNRLADLSKLAA